MTHKKRNNTGIVRLLTDTVAQLQVGPLQCPPGSPAYKLARQMAELTPRTRRLVQHTLRTKTPAAWAYMLSDDDNYDDFWSTQRFGPEGQPRRQPSSLWLHVINIPVSDPVAFLRQFATIEGEVCCSTPEGDDHLLAVRGSFFAVGLLGTPTAVFPHDVYSSVCPLTGRRIIGDQSGGARTEAWVVPAECTITHVFTDVPAWAAACTAAGYSAITATATGLGRRYEAPLEDDLLAQREDIQNRLHFAFADAARAVEVEDRGWHARALGKIRELRVQLARLDRKLAARTRREHIEEQWVTGALPEPRRNANDTPMGATPAVRATPPRRLVMRRSNAAAPRSNARAMAKRGIIEPTPAALIEPFVAEDGAPPQYALHFGTVDKVGVNPQSVYNTPIAVCAYPLTAAIFDQFVTYTLPFAQNNAKFLFVLRIQPGARVLYSTDNLIRDGYGIAHEYNVNNSRDARLFFYNTRPPMDTPRAAFVWGNKLRKMGIDVWVDADEEGILHRVEPTQTMFFSPSSYEIVLSIANPRKGAITQPRQLVVPDFKRAKQGDKELEHADLKNANLGGANLKAASLGGADLTGANLTGANLMYADLAEANLMGANLTGANLTEANLMYAYLGGANLKGANLKGADLKDARLTGADLAEANLSGARLGGANLKGANLKGADLMYAYLEHAKLEGANLEGANLERAGLGGANLEHAKLEGANLTGAKLAGADLRYADLTGADLRYADLTGSNLTDAVLDGANLTKAYWNTQTVWPAGFAPKH